MPRRSAFNRTTFATTYVCWKGTRLKITSVLTRICVKNLRKNCIYITKQNDLKNSTVKMNYNATNFIAWWNSASNTSLNLWLLCKAAGKGCRARLTGKAARQGFRAMLLARLPGLSSSSLFEHSSLTELWYLWTVVCEPAHKSMPDRKVDFYLGPSWSQWTHLISNIFMRSSRW
jgi:hypothetical protein